MLDDEAFMKEHVEILQKRVLEMRELMEKELTRMKIPFCKGYAGFFSWIDLRAYLKEDSFQGEQELCRFLYDHGNIIVAPGSKYFSSQFGWFRWIFTCYEEEEMRSALQGLEKALKARSFRVCSNKHPIITKCFSSCSSAACSRCSSPWRGALFRTSSPSSFRSSSSSTR